MAEDTHTAEPNQDARRGSRWRELYKTEDWWAVWIGFAILLFAVAVAGFHGHVKAPSIQRWTTNPLDAFYSDVTVKVKDWPETLRSATALKAALPRETADQLRYKRKVRYEEGQRKTSETIGWKSRRPMSEADRDAILPTLASGAHRKAIEQLYRDTQTPKPNFMAMAVLMVVLGAGFALAVAMMGGRARSFATGYLVIFLLGILAYLIADQGTMKAYGLPYALWALVFGLLISNTIGTPKWLLAGSKTELFIKTGLVLLGAEILFSKIVMLGSRGVLVAWLVTPCVILFMYFFGTRVLKMTSKSLVIIVAAATSVCGVSAAIATAAAVKAKKDELTLTVGMTLIFTVLMMIAMPPAIKAVGMGEQVGGAWMGGTIDATGAVVAAGALLGDNAEIVAAVVKMIQNILIGLVAFCVAVVWVTNIERDPQAAHPSVMEIWYRFPKFIVGFVAASLLFSFVLIPVFGGGLQGLNAVEKDVIGAVTKTCRGWLFCLAFVAIGLESDFRQLAGQMAGGKPIVLYLVGQGFNLILTLIAAYLAFGGWLFDAIPMN
ncbi:MAG: putative sulfate exporter family transporter [Pirellulales bacterium]|nr:putative sulfate exporter family transporter [Pirellulales bacterium]